MSRFDYLNTLGLSDDAAYFGCAMFGWMPPVKGTLTFGMVESRPTARSQAALDELVAKGVVSKASLNELGGVVYSPKFQFPRPSKAMERKAGKWPVAEPIAR